MSSGKWRDNRCNWDCLDSPEVAFAINTIIDSVRRELGTIRLWVLINVNQLISCRSTN